MLWRKPEGMKYVDLCIYVDEHADEIVDGSNPQVEELVYNYIWLLVKALAIKKRMFDSFDDYDGYAMYSASRLFFALRRSYLNAGKIIKGKEIKPIKSILNYTKALLYPMKLEYLHEQYDTKSKTELVDSKFNEFAYRQQLRERIWEQQGHAEEFKDDTSELFKDIGKLVDDVLAKAPFKPDSIEYKKIKISILLNCLQNLKNKKGLNTEPITVIVWKLPKSMSSYIRVFIKELGAKIKYEIMALYNSAAIDDKTLDYMISNPTGEFVNNEE